MEKELTCLRSIIADCDERITAALKTRMECIEGIITYKRENGLPVLQPEQIQLPYRQAGGTLLPLHSEPD